MAPKNTTKVVVEVEPLSANLSPDELKSMLVDNQTSLGPSCPVFHSTDEIAKVVNVEEYKGEESSAN